MKKRHGEKLSLNRIKKIMQANKEIGKIQQNTPQLMAWVLEEFIDDIAKKSAEMCLSNGDNKIAPQHIKEVILRDQNSAYLTFLKPVVTTVPDLVKSPAVQAQVKMAKQTGKQVIAQDGKGIIMHQSGSSTIFEKVQKEDKDQNKPTKRMTTRADSASKKEIKT